MAKTFNTPTAEAARPAKKMSSYGKRNQKRFNSMIGSMRNVDLRNLNLYEMDEVAGEARYNLR